MNTKILLQAMVWLLTAVSGSALAGKIILLPEAGNLTVDVDSEYTLTDAEETSDDLLLGLMAGYKFDNNMILALNYTVSTGWASSATFGAFDSYDLDERTLLIGYSWDLARHLRIVPMLGWNSWGLTAKEGAFLNPGEELRISEDGTNFVPRINFEIPFGELLQANIAYQRGSYDFGDASSWRFGFKFEF